MLGARFALVAAALIVTGIATTALLTGCAYAAPTKTVSEAQPDSATEVSPRSVSIVHPKPPPLPNGAVRQSVPANVAQHTFSTVGRDFDPDIAPDGQVMAFASTAHSEHPDIYIKSTDGFAVTQITFDDGDDVQPRFSPDGERVAFSSNRGGNWDIWIVNRDGTGLAQITRERADEIAPCWSPDGKRLALSAWGARSNQWEIWTVSVEHPGTRRYVCPGLFPAWSPDGSRVAFQRPRQRGSRWFGIWAVDFVGDEARHPTEFAWDDDEACIAPRWAADGRTLAYSVVPLQNGNSQVASLWTVDTLSGVRHALTDTSIVAFNPTWSPEGRVYFVSAAGGVENIWSIPSGFDVESASPPKAAAAPERIVLNEPAAAGGAD